ncbi:MAG: GTP-binding protein [Promethearchaeota archaeon]|nr:MAG: GTP-binding protein [Candidatus Lokiarchaeota archaeon]
MVIRKQEAMSLLLRNFIESQKEVEIAFIYSRQGLLISKYGELKLSRSELDEDEVEKIHGAISALIENLLEKITLEYKIGHFGTGSFETTDHRIIFLEAGPEAILLCVCNYNVNLNKLFPIAYLVVEKIAQILEESFDYEYSNLEIPDLTITDNFSLGLEKQPSSKQKEIVEKVKMEHHLKIGKRMMKNFKLIILGSAAVGKTTLVSSFLKKEQIEDYRPTLGIAISAQNYFIQGFKDDMIRFLIYDLAGQEFFKRVRHEYYAGSNCVFVVYDITRRDTFKEAIDFWYKDARNELGNIPFVLIGNKIDLEDQREVSYEEGRKMAEEISSFFIETSALKNINVEDTFKIIGIGLFFKKI